MCGCIKAWTKRPEISNYRPRVQEGVAPCNTFLILDETKHVWLHDSVGKETRDERKQRLRVKEGQATYIPLFIFDETGFCL